MTNLYIILNEKNILENDISPIKTVYDKLMSFSDQLQKHENSIEFRFEQNSGILDFIDHLSERRYKDWFRKVDMECPNLPYFLSGNSLTSSLSIYFLGCLPFEKQDGKLLFDAPRSRIFLEKKQHNIKNLCLGINIDPKQTISRMHAVLFGKPTVDETLPADDKREGKKRSLKTLLKEHGSVIYVSEDGMRGALLLETVYKHFTITHAHLFTGGETPLLRIYHTINDQKTYTDATILKLPDILKIRKKNPILSLWVVTPVATGYQRLFEHKIPSFDVTDELPPEEKKRDENKKEKITEESDLPQKEAEKPVVPLTECEKEVKTLKKEIKSLNATIGAMEEEMNAPRSGFSGFFRKLFK
ncbi:hypothetical protein KAH37_00720 [bacterium]|nr:hypothetical protein [bacterium]